MYICYCYNNNKIFVNHHCICLLNTTIMDIDIEKELEQLKKKVAKLEKNRQDQLSIAIVSGDMDKVLATMIISLAAAASDTKVKLFFSFWALSALRDPKKSAKGKNFISTMFGWMLPKGRNKLKLSKMNMMGMGPLMIKGLMRKQNVMSLDEMFKQAAELGIEIIVCEMSMNLMGFKKEEMIDYPNLTYAGAGTFIAEASQSSVQFFI